MTTHSEKESRLRWANTRALEFICLFGRREDAINGGDTEAITEAGRALDAALERLREEIGQPPMFPGGIPPELKPRDIADLYKNLGLAGAEAPPKTDDPGACGLGCPDFRTHAKCVREVDHIGRCSSDPKLANLGVTRTKASQAEGER